MHFDGRCASRLHERPKSIGEFRERIEQETGRRKQEKKYFNIGNARIDPAVNGMYAL